MVFIQKMRVSTFVLSRTRNNKGGKKRGPKKDHGWRRSEKFSQFNELSRHVNLALNKSLEIMQRRYKMKKRKQSKRPPIRAF